MDKSSDIPNRTGFDQAYQRLVGLAVVALIAVVALGQMTTLQASAVQASPEDSAWADTAQATAARGDGFPFSSSGMASQSDNAKISAGGSHTCAIPGFTNPATFASTIPNGLSDLDMLGVQYSTSNGGAITALQPGLRLVSGQASTAFLEFPANQGGDLFAVRLVTKNIYQVALLESNASLLWSSSVNDFALGLHTDHYGPNAHVIAYSDGVTGWQLWGAHFSSPSGQEITILFNLKDKRYTILNSAGGTIRDDSLPPAWGNQANPNKWWYIGDHWQDFLYNTDLVIKEICYKDHSTSVSTDTPTPTITDTSTPTHTPTDTDTPSSTPTRTATETKTATPTKTVLVTDTPTVTFTPNSTPTASPSVTKTAAPTRTNTPTRSSTPTKTHTPTRTVTVLPTVTATVTRTPPSGGDAYEPDDTCAQARPISTDGAIQEHTFHVPGDEDWILFQGQAGVQYLVEVSRPDGSNADVELEVKDGCAGSSKYQNPDFSPGVRMQYTPAQDGAQMLHLWNNDLDIGGAKTIYLVSVRALAKQVNPGAVIIVAGRKKSDDPVQPNIYTVTNNMYKLFLKYGYTEERIQYLANKALDADEDGLSDVDAPPTLANLQYAITDWALDKVAADRALTIFIFDHGDKNKIYLMSDTQFVTPADLDAWLSQIEGEVAGLKVNLILEACFSGSFIRSASDSIAGYNAPFPAADAAIATGAAIAALSKPGRVIITSTNAFTLAYASNKGAHFSDAFIAALDRGESLYTAFLEGRHNAKVSSYNVQTAWLDDNGDGLPNTGDGAQAQVRGFNYAGTFAGESYPPFIASAAVQSIANDQGVIEADVRDDTGVLTVWAVIYPPSYQPPASNTGEMVQENLPTVMLLDPNHDGIYGAVYPGFDEIGRYRIVIFAVDIDIQQGRPFDIAAYANIMVFLPVAMGGSGGRTAQELTRLHPLRGR